MLNDQYQMSFLDNRMGNYKILNAVNELRIGKWL